MTKTYDIDLDDELVERADEIFENLGTDIDTAIKIFLKQAVLRKGFPFELVIPDEAESPCQPESAPADEEDLHGGISEEEEFAAATVTATAETVSVPPVPPEIAARVAANEALVAEMRNEIGSKEVTPEFDENEDDGTSGNYEQAESQPAPAPAAEEAPAESESPAAVDEADEEDEDESTPENLFDSWDVGSEEEIGCR